MLVKLSVLNIKSPEPWLAFLLKVHYSEIQVAFFVSGPPLLFLDIALQAYRQKLHARVAFHLTFFPSGHWILLADRSINYNCRMTAASSFLRTHNIHTFSFKRSNVLKIESIPSLTLTENSAHVNL